MGGLRTLLAYAVLAVTVARAAASIDLSALPQCSVPCFISGLGISQCSPLDQDCLCHDLAYQANVTDCVKQSCKVPDQLITKNATWVGCGFPQNNHDLAIKLLLGIIYPTACAAVIARVVTKLLRLSTWGWDDYTILLAQRPYSKSLDPLRYISASAGRDIWTLTPYQIATFLKVFFIAEVSYTFELCIVKTSYLFFFLRVFQASPIRKPIIGTIIFTITAGAVFVLVDLVQCVPVELFWQQWDGEPHPGRCVNINAMAWSHAIINILLDFWMMALPASQVVRLRLAMSKKIGLVIMFSAGFLLTLVSILRLKSLTQFGESRENITMDFMMIAIYSPIECQAGIFCACLPAMSQLTQWMWAARRGQKDKNKTAASSTAKSKESSIHIVKTFGSQTVRRRGSDDEQELYILGYRDNHTSSVTAASGAADADADAEGSKTHLSESSLRHGGRGSTESPPG